MLRKELRLHTCLTSYSLSWKINTNVTFHYAKGNLSLLHDVESPVISLLPCFSDGLEDLSDDDDDLDDIDDDDDLDDEVGLEYLQQDHIEVHWVGVQIWKNITCK